MTTNTSENGKSKGVRPFRVAVTGGIGSGKTLVCRRLAEKGLVVVSTDELSRRAVAPGTEAHAQIAEHFGSHVLMEDQSVDRPALRRIISADPEAKKALESFVHPEVLRQMVAIIDDAAAKGESLVVVEVPLLFESGFDAWFDSVILVSVTSERRIERIMARDGVAREDALAMMKIQMPENEKRKRADFVIDNNGTETDTLRSVDRLYEQLIA